MDFSYSLRTIRHSPSSFPRQPQWRRLQAFRVLMDDHLGIGIGGAELALDLVADLMRADQAHSRIELDVALDEGMHASRARAQVVKAAHLRVALDDGFDLLALGVR